MQTPLLTRERDLYADVWASIDAYGNHAPGEHYLPIFLSIVGSARGTLLDAGCGSGRGGVALAREGFDVTLCDLTPAGLSEDAVALPFVEACLWREIPTPGRYDYAYCCDVLEHIPPQFTMLVVDQLLRVTTRGVFLSIALTPDHFGAWVGRPLHQTVQSFQWWRDSLRELGTVREARDLLNAGVFYVEPR